MNTKQHLHSEAAVVSIIIVILMGSIDLFVNIYDGHAYKIFGYIALFLVCYAIGRVIFSKLWRK